MKHSLRFFLLALVLMAVPVSAARITWEPAVTTTNKSQLIEGTPVLAVNGGTGVMVTGAGASGTASYTFVGVSYQGITFSPAAGMSVTADVSNGAPSTGDANFDLVLKSFTDAKSNIASGVQTIGGLIPGASYRIQVFYNDQRTTSAGRVMTYGDGTLAPANVNLTGGTGNWGQHAVGTFTANNTTQTLTHQANGFANVHFNAILVVQIAPPSAGTSTGLKATGSNQKVRLDWDDSSLTDFRKFHVKRAPQSGGPYQVIATTTESSFTDTSLTNGQTYYYVISTVHGVAEEETPNGEEKSATPQRPNFVFIITDDQDTYSIGAYRRTEPVETTADGQPYAVDTPNIDRLANEGMLFHNAHYMGSTSGAVCIHSRTQILTGRNLWHMAAPSSDLTMGGVFKAAGYDTVLTCKSKNTYGLGDSAFQQRYQADKRGNTDGNGSEWHANQVINYLNSRTTSGNTKPFLMYLGFSHPHDTRNARTTPNLAGRYGCVNTTNPASIVANPLAPPLPRNYLPLDQAQGVPANFPFHPFDNSDLNVRDEVNVSGLGRYRTEATIRNEIGRSFACVDWIDRQLGRVFAKLEDPNGDGDKWDSILDNTYIVFTTDHGIAIGRHGLQGKQNLYEHTWKVPFLVRGPGIAAGKQTDAMIYLLDAFPTMCDLAGIDPPSSIGSTDGVSFKPVLQGSSETARDAVYGVYAGGSQPGVRAVKEGRWKLVKYDVNSNKTQVTQLFDLKENPFELLPEHGVPNLALQPSHAAIRQRLEALLMAKRAEFLDPQAFLGDRTLFRFEEGASGTAALTLTDRFPWQGTATAASGNGGSKPVFSSDVPVDHEHVLGEANALSLAFDRAQQQHLIVPNSSRLSFGAAPFTIDAWVKFASLPDGPNVASRMPVAMKRAAGAADSQMDYLFLASAGDLGGASYANLALQLGGTVVVSSLSVPDTGWHHISVAFDPVSQRARFTLDGQPDFVTTAAVGMVNSGPLIIGAQLSSNGDVTAAFDGLIDELSITNGFLAEAEVQPLAGIPQPEPFRITACEWGSDRRPVNLRFESNEHYLYDIEYSTSLDLNSWVKLRSFIGGAPSANDTTISLRDVPSDPVGFFRVRCMTPTEAVK